MSIRFSTIAILFFALLASPGLVRAADDADEAAGHEAAEHKAEGHGEAGHEADEHHDAEGGHDDHAEAGHGGGHADGGHHGHSIGAEGVDENPAEFKSDTAIFTFIVFLLLLGILKKFAWGPIVAGLEKREGNISKQIADAEAAHEKAKALLAEHEYKMDKVQDEVREIIAEARRDAEHTRNEMISAAQSETEAMKNRAVQDIGRARDEAMEQLFSHMSESVAEIAESVIGRALSESDDRRLIDDALEKFSPSNN